MTVIPKVTKAEKKVLSQIEKLGSSFASPSMIATDLGLRIKTIKNRLKSLEAKRLVKGKPCIPHDNTMVYSLTEDAIFWNLTAS